MQDIRSWGFSQMNLVKDNFRTTLLNTILNNLLHININRPSLQNFDPINSIDKWLFEGGQKHIREHKRRDWD